MKQRAQSFSAVAKKRYSSRPRRERGGCALCMYTPCTASTEGGDARARASPGHLQTEEDHSQAPSGGAQFGGQFAMTGLRPLLGCLRRRTTRGNPETDRHLDVRDTTA
ncbi:UNVERIFIED_CONTAM: hypothetical protein HHA_452490 [Hammondia hammondi]|eukprot:XP_008885617.1 hypothetical protein HHA_452490 [Hammondia hammondi]